jgi:carboxymethylenebutenolidase
MPSHTIKIASRNGGEFDCYLSLPNSSAKTPAVVLASAVHGVDADIRQIADDFAARGFIAAAPDLFYRSIPGPLPRDDKRAGERSQPRLPKIKAGEDDLSDTLAHLRTLANHNGKAVAMGFCYGGPYAVIGPKRLGFAAGVSCHGTQMLDYVAEFDGVTEPVCVVWGDKDHLAPPPVVDAYHALALRSPNVEVRVFPGVLHGFTMKGNAQTFNQPAYDFLFDRTLAMLEGLHAP